jgi:hypothetical protein
MSCANIHETCKYSVSLRAVIFFEFHTSRMSNIEKEGYENYSCHCTKFHWHWIENIHTQILPNNRDVKNKDTTLLTPLIKAQLSLYGFSQNSCILHKFLQKTPIMNIMKIRQTY